MTRKERQKMLTLACNLPRTPALAAFWARVDANLKAGDNDPKLKSNARKEKNGPTGKHATGQNR